MSSENHPKKLNGLTVVITTTVALLMGIAAIFLPMQGQIGGLNEDIGEVEKRLEKAIGNTEKRSAGRRVEMDTKLQIEIREARNLTKSEVEKLDEKLQLEIKALREIIEKQLIYADRRYIKNEADIRLLLDYHRNATNAEIGK